MPVLAVSLGQHSEAGRKEANQDFHGACIPRPPARWSKGIVAALADGIASSAVGREASEAAVRAVLEDYYATAESWSVKRAMERVLAATNGWLHAQTQRSRWRHEHDRGWVCAFAAVVLKGRTAHVFHAGDVRVSRLQGTSLEPLTQEHRVWVGGGRSYLSRALGFRPHLEIDYRAVPLDVGDVLVLACDGVHEHVTAADVALALREHRCDLDAASRALVRKAYDAGSPDNLTVQLLRVEALPEAEATEERRQREGLPVPGTLAPRALLDGYRIERSLHDSDRSHVYLATDVASGEQVALKIPSTELAQDTDRLDHFMMEEWIARRIHSPHVLQARGRDGPRSHAYVAMEYVEGRSLAQWMRDNPRPALETVRGIVEQIARGLQAMHRLEMLHLDLRPENVLVDGNGTARIIDFGSVRVAGLAEASPDGRDLVAGTLQYTAPECLLGDAGSERSDLFSLGIIAYQMLTGRLPYGSRAARLRDRNGIGRLRYESALRDRGDLPAWLDLVLAKAVHPLPQKRYAALSEWVHDLRHPPADWRATRRAPLAQRYPVRFWQVVALLLLLVVLVQLAMLRGIDEGWHAPCKESAIGCNDAPGPCTAVGHAHDVVCCWTAAGVARREPSSRHTHE